MCLGASLLQSERAAAGAHETHVPVLAAFDPQLFGKLVGGQAARAPPAPTRAATRGSFVQHTTVDEQLLGKTKLCKFFARGHCSRGKACTYAHGRKELREQPSLFKTERCFEFTNTGSCHRGAACQYAHGERELRSAQGAPVSAAAGSPVDVPWALKNEQLTQQLQQIQRETAELRMQILALQASRGACSGASTAAPLEGLSRQVSGQSSALPRSWASDSSESGWGSPGASPAAGLGFGLGFGFGRDTAADEADAPAVHEQEPAYDTTLRVQGTFLSLVPSGSAERRRGASAPPLR